MAMMKLLPRIHEMTETLNQQQTIPSDRKAMLENCLILLHKQPDRLRRKGTQRSRSEYNQNARRKRAFKIYQDVLEMLPQMFLPFVLVVSPATCSNLKIAEVRGCLEGNKGIHPSSTILSDLETIAKEKDLCKTVVYKKLRDLLTPQVSQPKPNTIMQTDCFLCDAADMDKVSDFFNENLYKAVIQSRRRNREERDQLSKTTQCIRMSFPKYSQEDAIVHLDIGLSPNIVERLYPKAWERFVSTYDITNLATSPLQSHQYDNASFTFQGASTSEIQAVLGYHVYQAIEQSQMRKWEIDNFLSETTDCVILNISRSQPCEGTLCLRVGSSYGLFMATRIYSLDS